MRRMQCFEQHSKIPTLNHPIIRSQILGSDISTLHCIWNNFVFLYFSFVGILLKYKEQTVLGS